tara:strand:+ start:2426 stop:2596 length:171 start_codon:yes stop_codon:yes gene_type:complete
MGAKHKKKRFYALSDDEKVVIFNDLATGDDINKISKRNKITINTLTLVVRERVKHL